MYFVIYDDRTSSYFNADKNGWFENIVCATFFDYQTQADEIVLTKRQPHLMVHLETEDLSSMQIDKIVDILNLI